MNIAGEVVLLRGLEKEDLETLRVMRNEWLAENIFRQYRPLTSSDQEAYWERVVNHENFIVFAICIPDVAFDDGEAKEITYHGPEGTEHYYVRKGWRVIGECRVGYINWRNRWAELGIFLGKEYVGKGYGREALWLLMEYAFSKLGLHAIRAETVTEKVKELFEEFKFRQIGATLGTTYNGFNYLPDFILELYELDWKHNRETVYNVSVKPNIQNADTTIRSTLQ